MSSTGLGPYSTTVTLVFVAIVIVRFLMRELRERTVRASRVWIRPAVLVVLLVISVAGAFAVPRISANLSVPVMALSVLIGAALGVVAGLLVVRSTTFSPAGMAGAVRAKGNMTTVVVWVVALALRFIARYAVAGAGANVAQQYELNVGLIALVTAAFAVVAYLFHRQIDRLAPEPGTRTM